MIKGTILFCFVLVASTRSDGKTAPGISQFWSDDLKVFDQIYGKTSDKEIYGATLPPTVRFNINSKVPIQIDASEKKEKYLPSGKSILDSVYYPPEFEDRYAKLFSKSLYPGKTKTSSALQFISFSDIKPISESTDPETYSYLKHLEKMTAKKNEIAKKHKIHNFSTDTEADEAYRSIQDILDAHEANKNNDSQEESSVRNKSKHNDEKRNSRNRNRNKVRTVNGNSLNPRCVSGRCRSAQNYRSRPYVTKIKHYVYSRR